MDHGSCRTPSHTRRHQHRHRRTPRPRRAAYQDAELAPPRRSRRLGGATGGVGRRRTRNGRRGGRWRRRRAEATRRFRRSNAADAAAVCRMARTADAEHRAPHKDLSMRPCPLPAGSTRNGKPFRSCVHLTLSHHCNMQQNQGAPSRARVRRASVST